MKTYRIYSSNINNRTIHYEGTPIIENIGEIEWTNVETISKGTYSWDNTDKSYCDCPFIIGSVPVFPYSVLNILRPFFVGQNVQIIPIKVEDGKYVIVNTTEILDDVLNEKKSKLTRFQDGRIMDVEEYVLKSQNIFPNMFKLSQFPVFSFISEDLYNAIRTLNLTGIYFEECKMSRSLINFFEMRPRCRLHNNVV